MADTAADAVMLRKPKPVPAPQHSFLLDVAPVKETKAPDETPKRAPAPAVTPAPAVETSAVASPPPKVEKLAPPKIVETAEKPKAPKIASPEAPQKVAMDEAPKKVEAPKAEKAEVKAVEGSAAPVVPVEKQASRGPESASSSAVSKADKKKAKDAKKREKADKPPARDAIITADRTDYDRKEGVVLFDRHVHVDDTQYQMHADRLFLFLEGTNELKRLVAIGHVAITNEDKRAYCARATFNKKLGRVVMYSSEDITAELREEGKKGSDVKGEKITFWLDSEQVEVENPVITMPGGIGGQGNMKKLIGK